MPTTSYYETLAKTIRNSLYPEGVRINLQQQYARQSEFGRDFRKPAITPASKRKKKVAK